jgi:hypothetical protein
MAYIKINDVDYSAYCNKLAVSKSANYTSQTNAAGNTVVDYINSKRTVDVGIIPVNQYTMTELQNAIEGFNVQLTFKNPQTRLLETINCIIPTNNVEYYTIQDGNVLFNGFDMQFIEL